MFSIKPLRFEFTQLDLLSLKSTLATLLLFLQVVSVTYHFKATPQDQHVKIEKINQSFNKWILSLLDRHINLIPQRFYCVTHSGAHETVKNSK